MPASALAAHPESKPVQPRESVPQVDALRAAVERRLASLLPAPFTAEDRVVHAMREAVLSPGKRLRPLLMLTCGRALGVEPAVLLDVACALEIVHSASLTLDDLPCMDDAELRRGRPALHRAFGEDVAVLAAVAQLSLAYRIVAASSELSPSLRAQVAVVLADATGVHGLVRGQFRDLHASSSDHEAETTAGAAETIRLKTGSLFGAAFEIAALAAGSRPAFRARLQRCAAHIGQAFQLLDDLQDSGSLSASEPQAHADEDSGKVTLVTLLQARGANARLRIHVRKADALLQSLLPEDETLRALLQAVFGTHARLG